MDEKEDEQTMDEEEEENVIKQGVPCSISNIFIFGI